MTNVVGAGVGWESLVACALAGTLATLVARRYHAPFAAVAFAAVVSMIPGISMFRAASGMIEILQREASAPGTLIAATLGDAARAVVVVLAMGIGLVTPRYFVGFWHPSKTQVAEVVSRTRIDDRE